MNYPFHRQHRSQRVSAGGEVVRRTREFLYNAFIRTVLNYWLNKTNYNYSTRRMRAGENAYILRRCTSPERSSGTFAARPRSDAISALTVQSDNKGGVPVTS